MKGNSDQEVLLLPYHYTIAGACSGCLTRLVTQPLDVLKIRFQLQTETVRKYKNLPASKFPKYSGVIQAAGVIVREEGIRALWKGHVPAQTLSIVYNSIQFTAFEKYTELVWKFMANGQQDSNSKTGLHFLCGGFSGITASVFAHPIDVVRTRIVAQGEPKYYTGIFHAVRCMMNEGGIYTFYKVTLGVPVGSLTPTLNNYYVDLYRGIRQGLVPTLLAIFPNASLQFGFYHVFKILWRKFLEPENTSKSGKLESLTCGAMSGIVSKVLLLPFDVVKKRLQIQGFEEARMSFGEVKRYSGMLDCFTRIVKDEGATGLFKGFGPSVLKSTLTVSLTFFTYEQCCNLLKTYVSHRNKGDHQDGLQSI